MMRFRDTEELISDVEMDELETDQIFVMVNEERLRSAAFPSQFWADLDVIAAQPQQSERKETYQNLYQSIMTTEGRNEFSQLSVDEQNKYRWRDNKAWICREFSKLGYQFEQDLLGFLVYAAAFAVKEDVSTALIPPFLKKKDNSVSFISKEHYF
jgi:hypothetical protein